MNNAVCRMVGCEFPLFAFSHCRDVVVAVSKAGGFGVLGAAAFSPEEFERELAWIDAHIDGAPYGVDVLVPETVDPRVMELSTNAARSAAISPEHKTFTRNLLDSYGVPAVSDDMAVPEGAGITPEIGIALMEVAFRHPIKMIANALGIAPPRMIEEAHKRGIPVGALVGAKEHALRQAAAGVDIIVAQGGEAGGHCGEVATIVLVPEVVRALKQAGYETPVLAAGGIMTGSQMAGMMAMGAQGAWCGSVWLATTEAETSETFRDKMVAARSRDTIRSKARTGKPARQLKTGWHEAWEGPDSPGTLPMPLMGLVSEPSFRQIEKAAAGGNAGARELVSYFVGQGVGLVEQVRSARAVVQEFREEFAEAAGGLLAMMGE